MKHLFKATRCCSYHIATCGTAHFPTYQFCQDLSLLRKLVFILMIFVSSSLQGQTHQVQSSELNDLTGEIMITEGGNGIPYVDGIMYDELWISYTGDEEVNWTIFVNIGNGEYDLLNDENVSGSIHWDIQNNRYIVYLPSFVMLYDATLDFLVTVHADGYNDLSKDHHVFFSYVPPGPDISDIEYMSPLTAFINISYSCSVHRCNLGSPINSYYEDGPGTLTYALDHRDEEHFVRVIAWQKPMGSQIYGFTEKNILVPARDCGISISRFTENEPSDYYNYCFGYLVAEEGEIEYGEKESFAAIEFIDDWWPYWGYWWDFDKDIIIDGQVVSDQNMGEDWPISCVVDLLPYGDAFGGEHHIEVVASDGYNSLSVDTVLTYHPIDTTLTYNSIIIDVNSGMGGLDLFIDGEEVELSTDVQGMPAHIYTLPRLDNDYSVTVQVGNVITVEYDGEVNVLYQGRSQETTIIVPAKVPILATSIEISQTTALVLQGESLQFTATVLPVETTNNVVAWASSNPTVATVNGDGLVTAVTPGTATITATTTDGSNLSASCEVTVTENLSNYDNYLSMNDTTVFHGDTIVIPVQMNNTESIIAFQTDIVLPEGFSIVTDEDNEPLVTPSSRLTSDHVMMADWINDGSVRVICYSLRPKPINDNEGDLFYITVAVPEDADGDYTILLRNTLLTTNDFSELNAPVVSSVLNVYSFIPGDVNDSHTVTVTDIVFTAQYILQRNPSPFIFAAADMNCDGNISVTDIMLISNLIMTPTMSVPMRMPAIIGCCDRMGAEDITLAAGETRIVSIELDNALDYTAFQLDLHLPEGLIASNFQVTDRAANHTFDVNGIEDGTIRALCYSPAIETIGSHCGALLTFEVTATDDVQGDITVDGIELVTADCQTVKLNAFTIGVNNATAVNELAASKSITRVDYFNMAGQRIDRPESGVTLVVTTYTDGTRTTNKIMR